MADPDEPIPPDPGDGEPDVEVGDAHEEPEDREEATAAFAASHNIPVGDFAGSVGAAVTHATATAPAAVAPNWTAIGPRNVAGAVRVLVQDPSNPQTFYAGTATGGAWKSVDDGLSWRPIGGPAAVLPVAALAVAPTEPRLVYIGTGESHTFELGGRGFHVSRDGGETWTVIVGTPPAAPPAVPGAANHYAAVAVDPLADATNNVNGAGTVTTAGAAVNGAGTAFTVFLVPGDVIRIGNELRIVTAIANNTTLTIDAALPVNVAVATPYTRVSKRFWAAAENGLWRFDPGGGFVGEGPFPGGIAAGTRVTDVVLAQNPANGGQVVLYVGLHGQGLFRGVFTRAGAGMAWTRCVLPRAVAGNPNIAANQIGRVRVAMSRTNPPQVYAVMENRGAIAGTANHPTHVYHSANFGTNFTRRNRPYNPANGDRAMSDYALVIAVHPTTPATVALGSENLYQSTTSGIGVNSAAAWTRIMRGILSQSGDLNVHSDQHALLYDSRPPHRLWSGHDNGISQMVQPGPPPVWRKRNFGLSAAQFHDVSVHQTLGFITAGGLRDNDTFISYGGLTWYRVGFGDGGPLVFTNNPRVFFTSSQNGIARTTVAPGALPGAFPTTIRTPLPEIRPATQMRVRAQPRSGAIGAANAPPFIAILEGHPTENNAFLIGRMLRAFRTTNGGAGYLAIGAALAAGESVSAIVFIPGQPSNQFWMGTTRGRIFRTGTAAAISPPWPPAPGAPPPPPPPPPGTPRVHRIAIVSTGGTGIRVAVCSADAQGEVFVADLANPGAAVNWIRLTAGLPPGPFTSLAFDPNNVGHLYVGTLAGVYGTQNLPAAPMPAATVAAWQTFNSGLPLAVVEDLTVSPITQTLRCATYGRGMFERSLVGTPAAFQVPPALLLIRNHVMDDGRIYPAANTLNSDPRQGAAAATAAIDDLHSYDIRVDSPRFRAFEPIALGEPIDGGEFDESLVHDDPILGDNNIVYVQVQNRGHTPAQNVDVHLYFAAMPAAPAVPDLQAGFRAAFPGDPPAGAWRRVGPPITVGEIGAGAPAVVTFDWEPPIDLGATAALLAACTSAADALNLADPALTDVVATLVHTERRVAVRVMTTVANPIYVRDAVDDDGTTGAVAWGGRSPDIVVLPAAPPADVNARQEFSDLDDPRLADRVRGGNANHVIVRVHNRLAAPVTADVDLYRVQLATLTQPATDATWVRLHAAGAMRANNIPARGWRFTNAVQWNVPDADTTFILVAIVGLPGAAPAVPKPDHRTDVTNVDTLWRFLKSGPLADKVAMRCLRRA